jgi:hypothetical protein
VDATCRRLFSIANTYIEDVNGVPHIRTWIQSIRLGSDAQPNGFANTRLSLSPEQYSKVSTRNVVSYLDYPRYISNSYASVQVLPNQNYTITSQGIQLSLIPDLFIIAARVPLFLTIENISINFNNSSGLLASCPQHQLYATSRRNGECVTIENVHKCPSSRQIYTQIIVAGDIKKRISEFKENECVSVRTTVGYDYYTENLIFINRRLKKATSTITRMHISSGVSSPVTKPWIGWARYMREDDAYSLIGNAR